MIRTIVVPTDFSQTANNACAYALALAELLGGANIKLVHAFMPSVEMDYPGVGNRTTEYLRAREEMLQQTIDELSPKVTVEQEVLIGFAADELVNMSKDADLIVMGTTGQGGLLTRMFGSVSTATAQRAECPVLLVPNSAAFNGLHAILYASNYESADEALVEALIRFNTQFKATVHFVHVREEGADFGKTKEEIFEELFVHGEPTFGFSIAEIDAASVPEGLASYAVDHNIDLLVMAHRKRSFWQSMFHKSQTKEVALSVKLPILVFHC